MVVQLAEAMNNSFKKKANESHGELGYWDSYEANPLYMGFKVTSLSVIDVTAIIGNTFVCLSVYKNKRLRSKTWYLILALAITDLVSALVVIPMSIASLLLAENGIPKWIMKDIHGPLCYVQGLLLYSLTGSSLWIMTLAAISRFLCVVHKNWYRKYITTKVTVAAVVFSWLSALCLQLMMLALGYAKFRFLPRFYACIMYFDPRQSHIGDIIAISTLVFWMGLPLATIFICYTSIYLTVRRHNKRIEDSMQQGNKGPFRSRSSTRNKEEPSYKPRKMGKEEHIQEKGVLFMERIARTNETSNRAGVIQESSGNEEMAKNIPETTLNPQKYGSTTNIINESPKSYTPTNEEIADHTEDEACSSRRVGNMVHFDGREREVADCASQEDSRRKKTSNALKQNFTEARITRAVLAVFCGFCCCWIPALIVSAIHQSKSKEAYNTELFIVALCGALSTSVNPFIYAFTVKEFRKTYANSINRIRRFASFLKCSEGQP